MPGRFLIRADASVETGTGHVMRCLTLAHRLAREGGEVRFVCRHDAGDRIDFIRSAGFIVNAIEPGDSWDDDADRTIAQGVDPNRREPSWVVVDHYGLDARWEQRVQSRLGGAPRVFVIDDLANRSHDCHLLLDQNLVPNHLHRYDALTPPAARRLLGPKYALVRDEFYEAQKTLRVRNGTIHRILVLFGGTDPRGDTLRTLAVLEEVAEPNVWVDVVVGAISSGIEAIKEFAERRPNTACHVQARNVAALMADADLLIGAAGTSSWERCLLGLPAITLAAAENQREVANTLGSLGTSIDLGLSQEVQLNALRDAVNSLAKNPARVRAMSDAAFTIVGDDSARRDGELLSILLGENG